MKMTLPPMARFELLPSAQASAEQPAGLARRLRTLFPGGSPGVLHGGREGREGMVLAVAGSGGAPPQAGGGGGGGRADP
jgi:hypothetical protein